MNHCPIYNSFKDSFIEIQNYTHPITISFITLARSHKLHSIPTANGVDLCLSQLQTLLSLSIYLRKSLPYPI